MKILNHCVKFFLIRNRLLTFIMTVAEKTGDPAAKTKAITEGIVALEKNLELAPNCPNTHKWIAILLASKDEHESLKHKIEEAFIIREHLEVSEVISKETKNFLPFHRTE